MQEVMKLDSAVPARQEPTVLEVIQQLAVDPRVDVDKLAALMGLQERVEARNAEKEFNIDLAAAMAEMPSIRKNAIKNMGDKGSIPYATYEQLDRIIRPIEKRHGFCRIFTSAPLEKPGSLMTVKLIHRGGHSISSTRYQPPDPGPGRNEAQAIGSADSYARRYLTLAIWNLVTVGADDDAESTGLVSDKQLSILTDLVNACEFSPLQMNSFLKWIQAEAVEKIKARDFQKARDFLKGKVKP